MILRPVIIIIILLSSHILRAQQADEDYLILKSAFEAKEHHHDHGRYFKNSSNEVEFVVGGLFWAYKSFISSQDGITCVFYPSCSQYAIDSFKKNGILLGAFDAFDRLCRCNMFSPELYTIHPEHHLFYDPVE